MTKNKSLQDLQERYRRILQELHSSPLLVAVSKTFPLSAVLELYGLGQRHFGENRVQELQEKAQAAKDQGYEIVWHFIGNLQSNKVKACLRIPGLGFIHSVDSLSLLKKISQAGEEVGGRPIGLFFQVNTSGEKEKQGAGTLDELRKMVEFWLSSMASRGRFTLEGLMTLGNLRGDDFAQDARACFSLLRDIRDQICKEYSLGPLKLSMGMSQDFHYAMEYDTDVVRIGSSLFGDRDQN